MLQKHHTAQDLYRIMHQYARNEVKHRGEYNVDSAFMAGDRAMSAYIDNFGYEFADYEAIAAAERAVLWAIHWQFFATRSYLPLWASERRIAFVMEMPESGRESRSWFEPPRLP